MSVKLGTLTLDLVARISRFSEGLNQANQQSSRVARNIEQHANQMSNAFNAVQLAVGALGLHRIANMADQYIDLQNQLKLVTNSQQQLNVAMGSTYQIAQDTAMPWNLVSTVYNRYAQNAEKLGLSQEKLAQVVKTTAQAMSISGGDMDSINSALTQFGQGLAAGQLRGQEFNSVMLQATGLAQALATGLGVDISQLRQMATDGKLTGEVIIDALGKSASSVEEKFNSTNFTISQGFQRLSDSAVKFIGEGSSDAVVRLVNGLKLLADNFQYVAYAAGVFAAVAIVKVNAAIGAFITTTVVSTATKVADMVATRRKIIEDYNLARSQLAATAAMVKAMGVTNAQTAALMANAAASYRAAAAAKQAAGGMGSVALGLVGGWAGFAVTIAAVAAGYLLMRDNADEATKSLASQATTIASLAEQYRQLSLTKLTAEISKLKTNLKDSTKEMATAWNNMYQQVGGNFDFRIHKTEDVKFWQDTIRKVRDEVISTDKAIQILNERGVFSKKDIDKVAEFGNNFNDAKDKVNSLNLEISLAEESTKGVTDAFDKHNESVEKQQLNIKVLESEYNRYNTSLGKNIETAKESAINNNASKQSILNINTAIEKYSNGTMTASQLAATFSKNAKIKPDILQSLEGMAKKTDDAKVALDDANTEMKNIQDNAPKTKSGFLNIKSGAELATDAINDLTEAYSNLLKKSLNSQFTIMYELEQRNSGVPKGLAEMKASALEQLNADPKKQQTYGILPPDIEKALEAQYNIQQQKEALNKKEDDAIKAREKAIADAEKKQQDAEKKQQDEDKRRTEERLRIDYEYYDRSGKAAKDFENEVLRLKEYGKSQYIGLAQKYYNDEQKIYDAELAYQLYQFKMTETEKLTAQAKIEDMRIQANRDYTSEEKKSRLIALEQQYNQELSLLKLSKEKRIFEASQTYMSEAQIMQKRYEFERQEIIKTIGMAEDERMALLQASHAKELFEKHNNERQASLNWGNEYINMTGASEHYNLMQEKNDRFDMSSQLFDAQIALAETAEEREAIWQAHNDRMLFIEQDYKDKSLQLNIGYGQDILGSLSSIAKNVSGENSSLYKTMFAMEKGMAVARSIMAIQTGIAQAAANPFPLNLAAMASVASATASIIGTIKGVEIPSGMAHDGIDNIPQEGTWLLDKGERVLSPRQNTDLTKYLNERQDNNGVNIQINNNTNADVSARQNADGSVTIDIMEKRIKQAFSNMSNPNSFESKQVQRNFNTTVKR